VEDSRVLALEMTHVGLARVIDEGVLRFLSSSASANG
jgi:hypothetical protein